MTEDNHPIEHPIKVLTIGKAAIAGLLNQIVDQVKEAEEKVIEGNKRSLLSLINKCALFLQDTANGMPPDKAEAKDLLKACCVAMGMKVSDDIDIQF